MTQENKKQLLLKDLCARLPYGVLCYYETSDTFERIFGKLTFNALKSFVTNKPLISEENQYKVYDYCVKSIKPYLRPMSSMTEEEKKEISVLLNHEFYIDDDYALVAEDDRHRIRLDLIQIYIDWLDANKFDYRGLIPMGLAIEVAKENNPYKEINL